MPETEVMPSTVIQPGPTQVRASSRSRKPPPKPIVTHCNATDDDGSFVKYINYVFKDDEHVKPILPIEKENLAEKCRNGIIFCKLVNLIDPDTIDERVINYTFEEERELRENLTLSLTSAMAVGCQVNQIVTEQDILAMKPESVRKMLWETIREANLIAVDPDRTPGLWTVTGASDARHKDDVRRLPREEVLLKWVNWVLKQASDSKQFKKFPDDFKDSTAYAHLFAALTKVPGSPAKDKTLDPSEILAETDLKARAAKMLEKADEIGYCGFPMPDDIVKGHKDMNTLFVAHLFTKNPPQKPAKK